MWRRRLSPGRSQLLGDALVRLPFPTVVVTINNDESVSVERAQFFAEAWRSWLIDIGPQGHINGASGHGLRPEGEAMFEELCVSIRAASLQ
jgi:predicted alpha/beta hydrolase family esterase